MIEFFWDAHVRNIYITMFFYGFLIFVVFIIYVLSWFDNFSWYQFIKKFVIGGLLLAILFNYEYVGRNVMVIAYSVLLLYSLVEGKRHAYM